MNLHRRLLVGLVVWACLLVPAHAGSQILDWDDSGISWSQSIVGQNDCGMGHGVLRGVRRVAAAATLGRSAARTSMVRR